MCVCVCVWGGDQCHTSAALPHPGKRSGTHCTGGWVGIKAGLDRCGKSCPPLGFDPQTAQPIASHFTNYAVLANIYIYRERERLPKVFHDGLTDSVIKRGLEVSLFCGYSPRL
jgi:hypothetical protein